jgi:putative peptidoglycan lipid II flippase
VGGVFSLVAAALFATASFWAPAFFAGFAGESRTLLIHLTRVQLLSMVFSGISGVLWAYFHSQKRFVRAELSQLIPAIATVLALVLLLPRFGIVAAAWLSVGRTAATVLLLLPGLGRPRLSSDRSVVREAWRRIRPLLTGAAIYKTEPLLDRVLTSLAPAGGLSLFYFGQQLFGAAAQISNSAVAAPLVPALAEDAKRNDWEAFTRRYRRRLRILLSGSSAAYVLFLLIGQPLLRLIIGRGGVTSENVALLWLIMAGLGGYLIAGILGQVTSVTFYAEGDTLTPTRIGVVNFLVFVPVKIFGFVSFGLIGLAIATSAYYVASVLVQYYVLHRRGVVRAGPPPISE